MPKIIVVGCGMMGLPIIWALKKLNHQVLVVEKDRSVLDNAVKFLTEQKLCPDDYTDDLEKFRDVSVDTVISAAPYHANYLIAYDCIANCRRYCDLGGNPIIDAHIEDYFAKVSKKPCMVSLGLAPGFVNLIAEFGAKIVGDLNGADVRLYVGGLPTNPHNTLKYNKVFSVDGLYNEYTGKCEIIRKSTKIDVATLTEIDCIDNHFGQLEAFHTKGGLGSTLPLMLDRGVNECFYKTIRYQGHCTLIKFLLNECRLDKRAFCNAIESSCSADLVGSDMVLIDVHIVSVQNTWIRHLCFKADGIWSAMQRTTAFPAAVVCSMLSDGKLDMKPVLNYSDINMEEFLFILEKLGINLKPYLLSGEKKYWDG